MKKLSAYCFVFVVFIVLPCLQHQTIFAEDNAGNNSAAEDRAEDAYNNISDKTEKEYYEYMERFGDSYSEPKQSHSVGDSINNLGHSVLSGLYALYSLIRQWSPLIGIFSVAIGVIIAIFARKNKGLRKFGISIAVSVPLLLIFIVYGIGYLNSIYL